MCSQVSKGQPNSYTEVGQNREEDEQEEEIREDPVTTHLNLKPAHTTGTVDKAVVLRRIRHRKHVNKVKSAVRTFLSSPFASTSDDNKSSVPQIRWVDDAFAAP